MVKLEDAIKHAEEKSGSCECGKEHAQLAKWLKELTALRAYILAHDERIKVLPWDNQVEYGKLYRTKQLINPQ